MIVAPFNSGFTWLVDNMSTISDAGYGTSVSTGGAANAKGTTANILNGIAEDGYYIEIAANDGNGSAAAFRFLADVKIDPAAGAGNAGSSWTTIINNLFFISPGFGTAIGTSFGFPLFIPKGSAIGVASQGSPSGTCCFAIRILGKPQRPELIRTGSYVQTLGAVTASTQGTSFTPGTSARGSWSASLGTLSKPSWWWQVAAATTATTQAVRCHLIDVSFDTTSKYLAMQDIIFQTNASEQEGIVALNGLPPVREAPSGADVFIRGASIGAAPVAGFQGVVYALGG